MLYNRAVRSIYKLLFFPLKCFVLGVFVFFTYLRLLLDLRLPYIYVYWLVTYYFREITKTIRKHKTLIEIDFKL